MGPVQKQLRAAVAATAVALSLLTVGPIAVGQTQQQQSPIVSSKLNLTMDQRHIIKEIVKGLKVENEPSKLQVGVGQVVPKAVLLRAMPADISDKVSQVKSHLFFLKNDKVVLVDPKDNKIVDVIELQ
jgi:hypothetical protein